MKTIVIATDFSETALNAAFYGADLALGLGANIHLLHVFDMPFNTYDMPVVMTMEEAKGAFERDLTALKEQLVARTGGAVTVTAQMLTGDFLQELKTVCKQLKPYTVVIGSQGTSKLERMMFGSHAVRAMKHLSCPVITVPRGRTFSKFKKIAFACDLEEVEETIPVQQIKEIVKTWNAQFIIVNSGKPSAFEPELVPEARTIHRLLKECNPIYHLLSNSDPDRAIIDFVESRDIDLLLVLPKRQNFFDNFTHQSHTKKYILRSHVPVMAVHPLVMEKAG
ncbi:MAG: universal stress protein [Agriterribacter sp.]